jgi:DNA-binding NtrC family response regulator
MVFDALSRHQHGRLSIEDFRQTLPAGARFDQRVSDASPFNWRFPPRLPTLAEMGEILSDEALRRSGGNQSSAGRMLGISQQALNKRLKKRL